MHSMNSQVTSRPTPRWGPSPSPPPMTSRTCRSYMRAGILFMLAQVDEDPEAFSRAVVAGRAAFAAAPRSPAGWRPMVGVQLAYLLMGAFEMRGPVRTAVSPVTRPRQASEWLVEQ